ncbi:cytochrome P450 93A3 [Cajanus cajan]|uniref:cytochrome P450 93A3 n=1 Tax=Cajanus cajan TaxID=3821 RepID=UPI00098D979D|nr:cytochrome P450 93A3 [Cajanus cajan]
MAFQVLLICLMFTIIIMFTSILGRKQNKTLIHLPPSPIALPIIGHLHLLSPIPHNFHKLSIHYGPIIHLFLGSVPCVVVSTAEAAKEFLKTHGNSFSDRPRSISIKAISYGYKDFMFAQYGSYWKFMKKLCMSQLLGARMLDQFLPVRRQETQRFIKRVLHNGVAREAMDFGKEFMTLSNRIVSRMSMSRTSSENENEDVEIRKLMADTAELMGKFNISDFICFLKNFDSQLQGFNKRLKQIRHRFDTLMDTIIKEREEQRRKNKEIGGTRQLRDMLDVLLDILEDENSEMKLDKENIKAFFLNIFVAGTDTSAITMEWAMAELINNPHVLEKARQEMDVVIGKSRIVEESDIVNLPYLQAIVKETLRIHPAGPLLFRASSKSAVICGYDIPAKTRLFINVWAIGRDPNHWENPLEFKPERFIGNGQSQLDVRGQHYHLIPFGSGTRGCPGTSLALQVMHVNLAAMIQCFQWKVYGNGTVDMKEKSAGITVPRAHPIICVPVPRLNPFPLCD